MVRTKDVVDVSQNLWSFMLEENLPDVSFLSHLCLESSSDHVLDHVHGRVLVLNGSDFTTQSVQNVQNLSSIKMMLKLTNSGRGLVLATKEDELSRCDWYEY